jgi:predicted HicB family RNase H-like nuclease
MLRSDGDLSGDSCVGDFMADDFKLTQEWARSWVEAGSMPLAEYLNLCRENGWEPEIPGYYPTELPKRAAEIAARLRSVDRERG